MKSFRLLTADEIECRVQNCTEKGVKILLYKTARTDADLLDETVGTENWENDFKLIDGVLYGGIRVYYGDRAVWKWDVGTESNTEAEKGRASDAFKRAGFKHGIGRELYSAPTIWIPADKCNITPKGNGFTCYDNFTVSRIEYSEERITALTIAVKGREVFTYPQNKVSEKAPEKPVRAATTANLYTQRTPTTDDPNPPIVCRRCGKEIEPYTDENGNTVSPVRWAAKSRAKHGDVYCLPCMKLL